MPYWGEFRSNWRYLTSASLGLAAGYIILAYINNLFVPSLMKAFGWSSSQIAFVGVAAFCSIVCQPVAGRLTDRFGVRPMAMFGVACEAMIFLGFSCMTGRFAEYLLLNIAMMILVASTTTAVVYSRLVGLTFRRARGVAVAVMAGSPPLVGAIMVPFLTAYIDHEGWRAAYRLIAAYSALGGVLAIMLVPPLARGRAGARAPHQKAPPRLRELAKTRAFKLIVPGMFLCSLTMVMQASQLKVILTTNGLAADQASLLISVYAIGVVVGLLVCGAAFDRFPPYLVTALSLSAPAAGFVLLASGTSQPALLLVAVLLLGLSMGAENNIPNTLVSYYFGAEVFSTMIGVIVGAFAFAGATGAVLLSLCLKATGSFAPFLLLAAVCSVVGAWLLWRLRSVEASTDTLERADGALLAPLH